MFCMKCGTKLNDDAVFCYSCGTKVGTAPSDSQQVNNVTADSEVEKNYTANEVAVSETAVRKKSKAWIIILVIAIIAAICAAIFFFMGTTADSLSLSGSMVLVYDSAKDETHVIYNNKLIEKAIEGDVRESYCESSFNGLVYAIKSEDNTLYLINEKGVKTVAYDVENFALAYNGSSLAYFDTEGNISMFVCADEKKEKIASDISAAAYSSYYLSISPDGKSVAFSDYQDQEYNMYVFSNGEKHRVAENMIPITVSDGAEGYFAYDDNDNLYYIDKEGEKERLSSSFSKECWVNCSMNEIIYSERSEDYVTKYYYYVAGGERIKISESNSSTKVLYPNNTLYRENIINDFRVIPSQTLMNGSVYLLETRMDGYTTDSTIIFIDGEGEKESISCPTITYISDYYFNDDTLILGKQIFRNGEVSDINIPPEKRRNIGYIVYANKGLNAYYTRFEITTGTLNLYYADINGNGEIKLYNDINSVGDYEMKVYNDKYLLLCTENKLYIFDSNGEKYTLADDYAYIVQDNLSLQNRNEVYLNELAYISADKSNGKNNVFTISPDLHENNVLDDILNPKFYESSVKSANNIASNISSSIGWFLNDAEQDGYGLYEYDSCIISGEINDEGIWSIKVSNVQAFDSSQVTFWTSEAIGSSDMNPDDYTSVATTMLAAKLANEFRSIKGACFEAYLYNGDCRTVWFAPDTSNIYDISSFSQGKNCYENSWSEYYNWTSGIKGVSSEGYVIGTSPELY